VTGLRIAAGALAAFMHANGIAVVYHSDAMAHGRERGRVGIDAHDRLMYRPL
jgi:hypothetical protein